MPAKKEPARKKKPVSDCVINDLSFDPKNKTINRIGLVLVGVALAFFALYLYGVIR